MCLVEVLAKVDQRLAAGGAHDAILLFLEEAHVRSTTMTNTEKSATPSYLNGPRLRPSRDNPDCNEHSTNERGLSVTTPAQHYLL